MITAKEARLLSEKNLGFFRELNEIEKKIREVASFGQRSLVWKPTITGLNGDTFLKLCRPLTEADFAVAWLDNQNKLFIKW